METAGITDIRNAFAGIFQQAAGLEKMCIRDRSQAKENEGTGKQDMLFSGF